MTATNLIQRIEAGLFSLSNITMPKLISMYRETTNQRLKDMLGCEIMYRKDRDHD